MFFLVFFEFVDDVLVNGIVYRGERDIGNDELTVRERALSLSAEHDIHTELAAVVARAYIEREGFVRFSVAAVFLILRDERRRVFDVFKLLGHCAVQADGRAFDNVAQTGVVGGVDLDRHIEAVVGVRGEVEIVGERVYRVGGRGMVYDEHAAGLLGAVLVGGIVLKAVVYGNIVHVVGIDDAALSRLGALRRGYPLIRGRVLVEQAVGKSVVIIERRFGEGEYAVIERIEQGSVVEVGDILIEYFGVLRVYRSRFVVADRPFGKGDVLDIYSACRQLVRVVLAVVEPEPDLDAHRLIGERFVYIESKGLERVVRVLYSFYRRKHSAVCRFEYERRAVAVDVGHSHIDGELVSLVRCYGELGRAVAECRLGVRGKQERVIKRRVFVACGVLHAYIVGEAVESILVGRDKTGYDIVGIDFGGREARRCRIVGGITCPARYGQGIRGIVVDDVADVLETAVGYARALFRFVERDDTAAVRGRHSRKLAVRKLGERRVVEHRNASRFGRGRAEPQLEMRFAVRSYRAFDIHDVLFPAVVGEVCLVAAERGIPLRKLVIVGRIVGRALDAYRRAAAAVRAVGLDPYAETVVAEAFDIIFGRSNAERRRLELAAVVVGAYDEDIAVSAAEHAVVYSVGVLCAAERRPRVSGKAMRVVFGIDHRERIVGVCVGCAAERLILVVGVVGYVLRPAFETVGERAYIAALAVFKIFRVVEVERYRSACRVDVKIIARFAFFEVGCLESEVVRGDALRLYGVEERVTVRVAGHYLGVFVIVVYRVAQSEHELDGGGERSGGADIKAVFDPTEIVFFVEDGQTVFFFEPVDGVYIEERAVFAEPRELDSSARALGEVARLDPSRNAVERVGGEGHIAGRIGVSDLRAALGVDHERFCVGVFMRVRAEYGHGLTAVRGVLGVLVEFEFLVAAVLAEVCGIGKVDNARNDVAAADGMRARPARGACGIRARRLGELRVGELERGGRKFLGVLCGRTAVEHDGERGYDQREHKHDGNRRRYRLIGNSFDDSHTSPL